TPSQHPSGRTLRNLLRRHPPGNLSRTTSWKSFGRPLRILRKTPSHPPSKTPSQPFSKTLSKISPKAPSTATSKHPALSDPFGARCVSRILSEPSRSPTECPLRSLRRNLLRSLSEKATCPECRRRNPPGSPRVHREAPRVKYQEAPECATCHQKTPSATQPSRKHPSAPRAPRMIF